MKQLKNMYKTLTLESFPETLEIHLGKTVLCYTKKSWNIDEEKKGLRYGENPDQKAALYQLTSPSFLMNDVEHKGGNAALVSAISEKEMLQVGKHPSKTNFTDIDSGVNILQYLHKKPACAILKHNNPSGVAWSDESIEKALEKAFWADRIAAFGGTIVVNRPLSLAAAELISENYFEVVAAPSFDEKALQCLQKRKNLRIFALPALEKLEEFMQQPYLDIHSLSDGGLIIQESFQNKILSSEDLQTASCEHKGEFFSSKKPNKQEAEDLLFAWAVCSGVSSNAIVFAKDGTSIAIGTGEQDRVGCVELAIHKAYTKHTDALCYKKLGISLYQLAEEAKVDETKKHLFQELLHITEQEKGGLAGSVAASDGFFPFRDSIDILEQQGIHAIIQPGGSLRDYEVIQATNEASPQIAMCFTGQRSFKH